jgi:two-component system, cell cycle response regulator
VRQEVSRAQRFRDPLSLLMVDLDYFKKVNDSFGHLVGDEVLCGAAAALSASVRSIDVVCRFGGEEFALILPRTPLAGALAVAQRVCFAVAQARPTGRPELRVTASVGVAAYPDQDIHGEQDLLRAADSALYRAKRSGRACVCTWPAPETFFLGTARPGDARA